MYTMNFHDGSIIDVYFERKNEIWKPNVESKSSDTKTVVDQIPMRKESNW